MSSQNLETMRGQMEENSKLFFQTANHTINLWPAAIFVCLLLLGKLEQSTLFTTHQSLPTQTDLT